MADSKSVSPPHSGDEKLSNEVTLAQRFMVFCGVVLVLAGAISMLYGLILIATPSGISDQTREFPLNPDRPGWTFVMVNSKIILFFTTGIVAILLGSNLMRRAISATAQTISDKDRSMLEPLIQSGDEKAIGQYVRLASLSGVTGVFTKLGFTGLPLATATLGVLLLVMALFQPDASEAEKQLLDLSKLVIGAFIGSFVQRQVASDGANKPEQTL